MAFIAQFDGDGALIRPGVSVNVSDDFTLEDAAKLKKWPDGTWREMTRDAYVSLLTLEADMQRMAEIDAEIYRLEQKAVRPLLAIQTGTDEPYDRERQAQIVNAIIDLRCERQNLERLLE